jgi:MHS family proline/betaine transporter-like MFS transporter
MASDPAPEASTPRPRLSRGQVRLTVGTVGLGTFIEWFEYASYAYLATTIAIVFFPNADPTVALLQTFGVFAISFLIRPVGGLFWGHFGDRIGPKRTLTLTIVGMGVATFTIGVLPGFATIGVAAPILLLLARMLQSFCASGEYSGAAVLLAEHAPLDKRARWVSTVPLATSAGFLGASVASTALNGLLGGDAMQEWGWRVPFLLAAVLTIVVRYIRSKVSDSPVRKKMEKEESVATAPLRDLVRGHWKSMLRMLFIMAVNASGYYLVLTYMVTYIEVELGLSAFQSSVILSLALILYLPLIFLGAWLSDSFGRRRLLIVNAVGFILISYPAFVLLGQSGFLGVLLIQISLVALFSLNDSTFAVYFIEAVPPQVRLSGFSIPFNFGNAIFGGTAPFIATWLISLTDNSYAPAFLIMGLSLLGLIALLFQGDPYDPKAARADAEAERRAQARV